MSLECYTPCSATSGERAHGVSPLHPPPPCDIPSGCCSFTGHWTVTRSSLRMLRRVAAFCRPLRPVLLLLLFLHSWSPAVGVLGLCGMWHGVPFARQRRPIIGVLRMCWLLPGSFDCFCCPHTSVHSPSIAVHSLPRCVSVRPRCPVPPRAVRAIHHMSFSPSRLPPPPALSVELVGGIVGTPSSQGSNCTDATVSVVSHAFTLTPSESHCLNLIGVHVSSLGTATFGIIHHIHPHQITH